jgi:hypothetical protein
MESVAGDLVKHLAGAGRKSNEIKREERKTTKVVKKIPKAKQSQHPQYQGRVYPSGSTPKAAHRVLSAIGEHT